MQGILSHGTVNFIYQNWAEYFVFFTVIILKFQMDFLFRNSLQPILKYISLSTSLFYSA